MFIPDDNNNQINTSDRTVLCYLCLAANIHIQGVRTCILHCKKTHTMYTDN